MKPMKKSINILIAALVLSLSISSCKKETLERIEPQKITQTNLQDSLRTFESIEDDPTISKFQDQYKNSVDFRKKFSKDFNLNAKRPQIPYPNKNSKL
jgi:hypothetical protein